LSDDMARAFSLSPEAHVRVSNPIASDQNLLRSSLLPGIWKNVKDNARHFDSFRLFEIGNEVFPDREVPHFTAALYKRDALYAKDDGVAGLLELKRLASCLLLGCEARPAGETRPYEHPQRAADIVLHQTTIGRLFEFHPNVVEAGRAAVLDLDLMLLEKLQPETARYTPLRRFPSSAFDLSVIAPPRDPIGNVEALLRGYAGQDLLSIHFLREFADPDGTRSLSYRLSVGAPDRTLSSEEVGAIRARIIDEMRSKGYSLKV
jgi:phenylalanyl-tRNA synthetase beta chain